MYMALKVCYLSDVNELDTPMQGRNQNIIVHSEKLGQASALEDKAGSRKSMSIPNAERVNG